MWQWLQLLAGAVEVCTTGAQVIDSPRPNAFCRALAPTLAPVYEGV